MSKYCLNRGRDCQFFITDKQKPSYNSKISATTIALTERICMYHAIGLRLQGCWRAMLKIQIINKSSELTYEKEVTNIYFIDLYRFN